MISALTSLFETNVSALAVTSESGQLVGAISLEDITEILRTKQRNTLFLEVHQFVVYIRSRPTAAYVLALHAHSKVSVTIGKRA